MKLLTLFISLMILAETAFARPSVQLDKSAKLDIQSLELIAHRHEVPLWALIGILATEKGKNGQAVQNKNLTWDLGVFQINTIHLNELSEIGIDGNMVLTNAKVNANVAAWLLSKHFKNNDIWNAIGKYHSKTQTQKNKYINKVYENIVYLQSKSNAVADLLDYVND